MTQRLAPWLVLFLVSTAHAAQRPDPKIPQGDNLDVPKGWIVRADHADHSPVVGADASKADIFFVNMTPGWHVTTGPAAIFYHPDSTASGAYRARMLVHLFDPKGRNEAFGMFAGGGGLEGPNQTYDYFLIRNSGEFLIKRREGAKTSLIRDWTKSDAIVPWSEGKSSVPNDLVIEARAAEVEFRINGTTVATLPRAEVRTDGIVGLRVNHRLNLHIEDLSVENLEP